MAVTYEESARAVVEDYCPAAPAAIKETAIQMLVEVMELPVEVDLRNAGSGVTMPRREDRMLIQTAGVASLLAPYRRPRARTIEAAE